MYALFADMSVSPMGATVIGLAGVAAFLAGKTLFQKDTEIENRRKAAIDVAGILSAEGFKRLPGFVTNYAVGDYSGMVHELKAVARDFRDPTVLEAELDAVFTKQLERRAKDPGKKPVLAAKLQELGMLPKEVASSP